MMTRLFRISVAREFDSSVFPLRATLLAIWLIFPMLLLADSASNNQRTVTKLAEGIYLIRHKNAPEQMRVKLFQHVRFEIPHFGQYVELFFTNGAFSSMKTPDSSSFRFASTGMS